jgi:hypothetical protein
MPSTSTKLFNVLVVLGAAAVGSAGGCTPEKPIDPDTATRKPSAAAPDRTAVPSSDRVAATEPSAPTCEGEGTDCKSNGVMCCWAHDPGCESCCG